MIRVGPIIGIIGKLSVLYLYIKISIGRVKSPLNRLKSVSVIIGKGIWV